MDNLSELIGLYGLDSLPRELQKQREIKRWRDIMAKVKYEQDYLDGFLDAEAQARESDISYEAWFDHKRRMAMRWFGYYRKAKTVERACEIVKQYNRIACMLEKDRSR